MRDDAAAFSRVELDTLDVVVKSCRTGCVQHRSHACRQILFMNVDKLVTCAVTTAGTHRCAPHCVSVPTISGWIEQRYGPGAASVIGAVKAPGATYPIASAARLAMV